MSLINKMLQDLDARGTPPGEAFTPQIKPVAPAPRRVDPRLLAAGVAGGLVVGALVWYGVGRFHAVEGARGIAVVVAAPSVKPAAAPKTPPLMTSKITMEPAPGLTVPAPVPALVPAPAALPAPETAPSAEAAPPGPVRQAAAQKKAAATALPSAPAPRKSVDVQSVAPVEPDSDEARAVRRALAEELAARQVRKPAARARPAAVPVQGREQGREQNREQHREQTAAQRAEGEYRRALASMQEGRMGETLAALESALRIDPGHEAARQTLVSLLIEAGRPDDAIRQLQLGLTQDPRQPALAMLLARLQIERGGSGIETLTRTLPYAGTSPDYHAFLAGALQRQQRHREAAAEYQAALRAAPGNGVWWMGMGISLQAEKRTAEALDAFQKAQGSGVLSAELQAFVERQIRQLGR